MIRSFWVIGFFLLGAIAIGQNKTQKPDYHKKPYWIDMIKDPNVNYFEALKAYEEFWKGREKPVDEDAVTGQQKQAVEKGKKEGAKEVARQKKLYKQYGLECKKFEHWKMSVKPYVQPDGHILSKEEQMKLWEEQKNKK